MSLTDLEVTAQGRFSETFTIRKFYVSLIYNEFC